MKFQSLESTSLHFLSAVRHSGRTLMLLSFLCKVLAPEMGGWGGGEWLKYIMFLVPITTRLIASK